MIGQALTKQGLILLFTQVQAKKLFIHPCGILCMTTQLSPQIMALSKLSLKCKQSITANVHTFLPGPSFHDITRKATIPVHLPHGLANSQLI